MGGAARFVSLVKSFGPEALVLFAGDAFNPSLLSTITQVSPGWVRGAAGRLRCLRACLRACAAQQGGCAACAPACVRGAAGRPC